MLIFSLCGKLLKDISYKSLKFNQEPNVYIRLKNKLLLNNEFQPNTVIRFLSVNSLTNKKMLIEGNSMYSNLQDHINLLLLSSANARCRVTQIPPKLESTPKTMNSSIGTLFRYSLQIVIVCYGSIYIFSQLFTSLLPLGLIAAILITAANLYVRIPPPSQAQVEAILGKDVQEAEYGGEEYVVRTVAHRGAGLDAPENTLAAFQMCKEKGCDFIEFDVCLTADQVPVVFHDNNLERMTGKTSIINCTNWSELADVNLSEKHPFRDRYPLTNIPTLDQTVTQLLASGQRMFIDIKDNDTKMVKVITDLFEKYPELLAKAIVTTFYPNLIYLIRRFNPNIVCAMAWRPYAFSHESFSYANGLGAKRSDKLYKQYISQMYDALHTWCLPRFYYFILGLSVILLHKDAIDPKSVLDWRKRGVRVMAWTVNNPIEKQYCAKILKITYLTDTLTAENTTHYST